MKSRLSEAFIAFQKDCPAHAKAWGTAIISLSQASVLDPKTSALGYIAVLAALGLESGIPFHVQEAKKANATKDEIISAILLGLPACGNKVIQALPAALTAYFDAP
jgi:alkylhydroperoxidase/carboxymuconolactone decarboxylase family protein YurZ